MSIRKALYVGGSTLAAMALATASSAQEAGTAPPSGSASDAPAPGEIVVTAQKRAENVQNVPKQVEVVSQAKLEQAGVNNIQELGRISPSIQGVQGGGGFNAPPIRGISSFSYSIGVQAQTGVVLDDVPQPSYSNLTNELADVERIEVLPGPQSTLSGRNAAGGLINVVTRNPSSTLQGMMSAEQTTDRQTRITGYVSGPLTANLGFVASGFWDKWSGPLQNIQTGNRLGGFNQRGGRLKLRWQPTDNFTATLTGFYVSGFARRSPVIGGSPIVAAAPGAGSFLVPGTLADLHPGAVVEPFTQKISVPKESVARNRTPGVVLRLDYDNPVGTLSSITSYQRGTQPRTDEVLGYPYPVNAEATTDSKVKYLTQELRLVSPASLDRVQYLLGAIYSDTRNFEPYYRPDLFPVLWDRTSTIRSLAVYGRLTYKLPTHTAITGGLRYQHDDQGYLWVFRDGTAPTSRGSNNYNFVAGEASLQQDLARDVKAYFTYANAQTGRAYDLEDNADSSVGTLRPLASEKVQSYELGLKSQWFDRRLTVNISLFKADYKNYQVQATAPLTDPNAVPVIRLFAIGKVRNKGAELTVNYAATQNLNLGLTASYLDAEIARYPGAQCYTGQTVAQGCVGGAQNINGAKLPGTAKFRTTVSANYTLPLPALPFDGTFGAFYRFQTKSHYDLFNDPSTIQPKFGILNLTVGVKDHDGKYSAELFVNNVANKHYYAGLAQDTLSPAFSLTGSYARDSFRYAGLRLTGHL